MTILTPSSRSFSRRNDNLDIWRRRGIIFHSYFVGAGRANIPDIVAHRKKDRLDLYNRDTTRERIHVYLAQSAARVREACSHEQ